MWYTQKVVVRVSFFFTLFKYSYFGQKRTCVFFCVFSSLHYSSDLFLKINKIWNPILVF